MSRGGRRKPSAAELAANTLGWAPSQGDFVWCRPYTFSGWRKLLVIQVFPNALRPTISGKPLHCCRVHVPRCRNGGQDNPLLNIEDVFPVLP